MVTIFSFFNSGVEPILEKRLAIVFNLLTSFSISSTYLLSTFSIFKMAIQPNKDDKGVPI